MPCDGKVARGAHEVFCLGTGNGFSVREVIDHSRHVTNRPVPVNDGPRRGGDAVKLVSGSEKAVAVLGWNPARSTLPQMIGGATPRAIREHLGLNRPVYARTAAYGHFGRTPDNEGGFSWEKTDRVDQLKALA